MSSNKIMTGEEIRMELARQKRTRVEIAKKFGLSYDYICKICNGLRDAEERRGQITDYLLKQENTRELKRRKK